MFIIGLYLQIVKNQLQIMKHFIQLTMSVLYGFLSLVFSLTRVRKTLWEDITVIKFLKIGGNLIPIFRDDDRQEN